MSETTNLESAPAVAVQRVVRARHPWQQMWDAKAKLKAARATANRRKSLKYRHENIEDRRAMERHWHRKKSGKLPLEAPVMTPHDKGVMGSAIRYGKWPNGAGEPRRTNGSQQPENL